MTASSPIEPPMKPFWPGKAGVVALRECEKTTRDRMPKAARAEMHPDPDGVILVREDVDVMIARADGAELSARLGEESFCLRLTREQRPGVAREERIVDRRIVGGVRAADAEAHRRRDLVREVVPIFALEPCCADVRAN